ncbi:DUF3905 domain-containing protein [Paenibacillus mesophilus]|uniref:DUF3905 domain-containing protein n=1 Tax=Paenibacillus mesophilus TaxID=2582849 RepID=UPI00110F0873|nr:DUF3905 domain-containing protein [Paenibacillus mesophilus]TMV45110.1 DUF3905 domain-containing protein [Paenibacillus mesophilus]
MDNNRDELHSDSGTRETGGEDATLDPFEINFLPQFTEGRGPREPFVNEFGVTIGDHIYESPESPLSQWTEETDPFIMAGDQWVHPFKDIGFRTAENRDLFEKGIAPSDQGERFMHRDKNSAYNLEDDEGDREQ